MIKVDQDAGDVYIHVPLLSLSSYAIRYLFKVLLPIPEVLFRKEEAVDKDKDEAPNSRLMLRATANHKAAVRTLSRDTHCIYLRRLPSIPQPSD
jgi:hypothetical protein